MNGALSPDLTFALSELTRSGCSLAVVHGGVARLYGGRGVKDLYRLVSDEPEVLSGASVADKVVGKGAAALMAAGGVKEVYALTVSESALELLEGEGVMTWHDRAVPHIVNRSGTGMCPVERLCAEAGSAAECVPLIGDFLRSK